MFAMLAILPTSGVVLLMMVAQVCRGAPFTGWETPSMLVQLIRSARDMRGTLADLKTYRHGRLLAVVAAILTHLSFGLPFRHGTLPEGWPGTTPSFSMTAWETEAVTYGGWVEFLIVVLIAVQLLPLLMPRRLVRLRQHRNIVVGVLAGVLAALVLATAAQGLTFHIQGEWSSTPHVGAYLMPILAGVLAFAAWRCLDDAGLRQWIATARREIGDAIAEIKHPATDPATSHRDDTTTGEQPT